MKGEDLKTKVRGPLVQGERSVGFLTNTFSVTDAGVQISTNMKCVASLVEVLQIEEIYLVKQPRHVLRLEFSTPAWSCGRANC